MGKVKFLPWIGSNYNGGFAGKRVLVLGDSHYCDNEADAVPTITRDIIRDLFDAASEHEGYKNTYTKFVKAMLGVDVISVEDKAKFWNSVAFYNYVQVPMSAARIAPSTQDFEDGADAFFEVLEELQPDVIIVWGTRLYNNLPKGGLQGKDIKAPDGAWIETWQYVLSGGKKIELLPIMHPSAAFSPSYWHEVISLIF